MNSSRILITGAWDDFPHITEEQKERLRASMLPYQRESREKGIPDLGAGVIYPIEESKITYDDFEIADNWERGYAMDVGWNFTAALFAARAPVTKVVYIYDAYKQQELPPGAHAAAILSRGAWMKGVVDPASRGRSQADGASLFNQYSELGLKLEFANNSVADGVQFVWDMMEGGKVLIARSLLDFWIEFRQYRRDTKGRIVKKNDHLMDCLRYLLFNLDTVMSVKPVKKPAGAGILPSRSSDGWMC